MLRGISLDQDNLNRIAAMFAGATVDNVLVEPGAPCIGRSLVDLDLRKLTGATVIAIARGGEAVRNPGPDFRIAVEDILVLLGSHVELDRAMQLLTRAAAADGGG